MALCKSCGAPVRIGKTCEYCGRVAEPDDYPNLNQVIHEVKNQADFWKEFQKIVNAYIGMPYTCETRARFEHDLNTLIKVTPAEFVPIEFRFNCEAYNGENTMEAVYKSNS